MELSNFLKDNSSGKIAEDIVLIKDKLKNVGIKLVYEAVPVPHQNDGEKGEIVQSGKEEDETSSETPLNTLDPNRPRKMILSPIKWKLDYKSPLVQKYCGAVVEQETWKILSIPPGEISAQFKNKQIEKDIHKYTIYEANDGTIITIYYHIDKWCISSKKGYDVSNIKWRGDKTYKQILDEVLTNCNYSLDNLDKTKCYTLGFKHPDFHPFLQPPKSNKVLQPIPKIRYHKADRSFFSKNPIYQLWVVQIRNMETLELEDETSLGLPTQKKVDVSNIPNGKVLQHLCNKARDSIQNFQKTKKPLYGYILRSNNPGEYSDLFIESSLMEKIRQMMYNVNKRQKYNSIQYMVFRAFIYYNSNNMFLKLFPQYQNEFNHLEILINDVINKVYAYFNKKLNRKLGNGSFDLLCNMIIGELEKNQQFSFNNQNGHTLIRDFILNRNLTEQIFNYIEKLMQTSFD